jgi:Ca2+-binding RTX toxin-like protein
MVGLIATFRNPFIHRGDGGNNIMYSPYGDVGEIFYGYGGADIIDGGLGADTMYGGTGDDTYFVDNAGDAVVENANEGRDWVYSKISYTLPTNVENLFLRDEGGAINGTGNTLDNSIYGNSFNNELSGGHGQDILHGRGGNDTLEGGTGFDTMYGGTGDDTYGVDNSSDIVIEYAGEGNDTVRSSSFFYVLPDNVENLTLVYSAVKGFGNNLNNQIVGNDHDNVLAAGGGDDVIFGGSGADTMYGGTHNDTYWVGDAGDVVVENAQEGFDTVVSTISYTLPANVEHLTLFSLGEYGANINGTGNDLSNRLQGTSGRNELSGGGGGDYLVGGNGNDTLDGGAGSDSLIGGYGADIMTGGTEADIFHFLTPEDSNSLGTLYDRITDFSAAEGDRINLSPIDANSLVAGDQAFTWIGNGNAFTGAAGELRFVGGQLQGDLDGDLNADLTINVNGASLPDNSFIL